MASERDHVSSSRWRIFVTHLQRNFIVAVGQNETIFNLKREILKSYDVINSSYGERASCFSGSSSSLSPSCIGLFLLNNYELCNHNIVADVLFDGASVITSHADPSSVGMVQNHPYQPNPSPAYINQLPYPLSTSTSVPFNYQRPMLLSQAQKSLSQFNISTARGGDFFDDLSQRPTCTSELGTRGPVPRSEIEIREPRTEFNERDTAPEDIAIDKERIKEKEQDPPPHPPLHPSTHEEEEEEEHTESERERALPAGATTVPPAPPLAPAPVKGKRKAELSLTDNTKAKKKKRISKKKDENTIPSTCTEDDEDTPTITGETSKVTKRSKKKQTTSSSKKMEAKTRKEDPVVPAVDMTKSDKNKSEKVSKKRQTTSTSKKTETKTRKEDSLSRSFVRELLSASSDEEGEEVPVPIVQLVEDKTEKGGKEREEALEEQREQEKESDGSVVKETAPIIQTASLPHTRSKNKRESKTANKASATAAATKKQPKKLALSKTLRTKTPTTAAAVHTPPLIVPADSTETKQDPPNKTKQVLTNKSKAKTVTIIDMLSESEEEEEEEEDEGGEGGKSAGAPGQEKNKTTEFDTLVSPSLSLSSSSDEDDEDITDKEGHPSIKNVAINTGNTVATGNTGGNTMDTGNTRDAGDTGSNDSLSEEEEEKENVNETPKASQELFGISKEVEGREGSEEIPIQTTLHKVKTTIPPTTPKKLAASNEDNEESSSNVSSSEEEEEEEREARKGGAVPSALSALVIDANPPSKKTVKKTSVVIPFKSKFQHKLKSSPAAIMPNKLAQKRKQQQTRKIGGIEQVTADEERLSQSLSQDDLSQMIANNESVWAV